MLIKASAYVNVLLVYQDCFFLLEKRVCLNLEVQYKYVVRDKSRFPLPVIIDSNHCAIPVNSLSLLANFYYTLLTRQSKSS